MKTILAIIALCLTSTVYADTYVQGHVTKNGTYVEPHYRSDANNSKFDNYSTQGNTNPYTGKQGNVDPYAVPAIKPYGSDQNNSYQKPYR